MYAYVLYTHRWLCNKLVRRGRGQAPDAGEIPVHLRQVLEACFDKYDEFQRQSQLGGDEDDLLECDALADSYNEWRRHVNSRLESEPDAYSTSPLTLLLGKSRFHIDVEDKSITMKDGTRVTYDKCLLASAGAPRDVGEKASDCTPPS